jgi:hypothetical protein
MLRWMGLGFLVVTGGVLLSTACGGSSSETPWPVEPLDLEPGPAGEELKRGNTVDVSELPVDERYRDGGVDASSP